MRALDRKLLRDLRRLWAQVLAIALVMAAGVAILVLANGVHESLFETRAAYYERYRFADVFADATRAPSALVPRIADIPGVSTVEPRISKYVLLDIDGMNEPASARLISLPELGPPRLNRLYLRKGRMPDPLSDDEVVVSQSFADAHGFSPGASVTAIMAENKRRLTIVGIALSPEFIYVIGPGDIMPDYKRFAIMWMPRPALEGAFDLDGAFNDVTIKLASHARVQPVIDTVDELLTPYGGTGAYAREDQLSHMFLDAELTQLRSFSKVLPPIFLFVAAFLVNVTLSRVIALEREQIGLMKAVGYTGFDVGMHYGKLVMLLTIVGIAIGCVAGYWLGYGLTVLYADFYHFPFLITLNEPGIFIIASGICMIAALAGGLWAVARAANLPPAVAMAPPSPPRYTRNVVERLTVFNTLSQPTKMIFRSLTRRPLRALITMLGVAMSVAMLIASLSMRDSIEVMVETTFFLADRQDATILLNEKKPYSVINDVARLPGVIAVEPVRTVAVRLRNAHLHELATLTGRPQGADISRVINDRLEPVALPEFGLMLSDRLARNLKIGAGEKLRVEVLEDSHNTFDIPVVGIVEQYLGTGAYLRLSELNRLIGDGDLASDFSVLIDELEEAALFKAIKELPGVIALTLSSRALQGFRENIDKNMFFMISVYTALSVVLAFGVVYNSLRIQLSERGRELASLRILGFTKREVSWILLGEVAFLTILAMPIGWLLGYGFSWQMVNGFDSDLYRIPFRVERPTFSQATVIVLIATLVCAAIVRRRIDRMDLVAVMKTRE